jgi:hypothetical protein
MRATVMYRAGDVRVENVPDARPIEPTDAVVTVSRAAICGSDLWPYRSGEGARRSFGLGGLGLRLWPGPVFPVELAVFEAVVQLAEQLAGQSAQHGFMPVAGGAAGSVVRLGARGVLAARERPPAHRVSQPPVLRPPQQHHFDLPVELSDRASRRPGAGGGGAWARRRDPGNLRSLSSWLPSALR